MNKQQSIQSTVGRRIKKSIDNEFGWIRNLKRGEIKFDKPVVLYLPGNGTNDDKNANGGIKGLIRAMGRIGVMDNDIQMLAAYYPKDEEETKIDSSETMKYVKTGDESIEEEYKNPQHIQAIYDAIISPILTNAKGKKRDIDAVVKKFRNLTIVSHCYGSAIERLLIDKIHKKMQYFGYKDEEINKCIGEIVSISVSPRIGYFPDKKDVLSIGFTAADDEMKNLNYNGIFNEFLYCNNPNFYRSRMGIGLQVDKECNQYWYGCGDTFDYKNEKIELISNNFGHSFVCYTNEDVKETINFEDIPVLKNENGKNFTRLICRTIQNAVSLSIMNKKRTIEEIVSNNTPIMFKQGRKENNPHTVNVRFNGNNEEFKENFKQQKKKIDKMKMLYEAEEKLKKQNKMLEVSNKLAENMIEKENATVSTNSIVIDKNRD